jgi:cystathionine beta-lyase
MDFPSPEPVIRALRERVEHGFFGYGDEQPEFYEVLVDRLWKRYGWRVTPDAIMHLPGVIPGFNLACRAFAMPGDGLLLQTPVYPPILRAPGNCGLSREEAELVRQPSGRYVIDFDVFAAAIRERTRVFLLCNPHNPVGRAWERGELLRMAEICLARNLLICADEIHCDLMFSGHQHLPIASLDPEIERRTITLMAPSKTFNLAGLKSSIAIIPNAALRERFVAAQVDLVKAVNVLGYTATLAAYRDGQPWLDELLRYLEANRDFVAEYVKTRLPGVGMARPEATYLAWLDCRGARLPKNDPYTFFLDTAKVALNDGATFGRPGQGFVRLNFGCPRSILAEGLERMRGALLGAGGGVGS